MQGYAGRCQRQKQKAKVLPRELLCALGCGNLVATCDQHLPSIRRPGPTVTGGRSGEAGIFTRRRLVWEEPCTPAPACACACSLCEALRARCMLPALCTGGRHAARGLLGGCRLRKSVGPLVWLGAPPARSCSSAPGLSWATRETLHRVLHKYSRDFRYKEPQPALPSCEELGRLEERIRCAAA